MDPMLRYEIIELANMITADVVPTEQALIEEYKEPYLIFKFLIDIITLLVVYFNLWPKGCPWYNVLLILAIISSSIEYGCVASLNFV
jgi:hypothetical protein